MDKVTLDRDVFKALASDTRLDILKALDVRQKTVTELARELELNKATVHEHLEKLADVSLIQKVEEDVERKWVYWQLSWTGRRLLHPEKITLAILLSSAGGSIFAAAAAIWLWLRSGLVGTPEMASGKESADAAGSAESMRSIAATPPAEELAAASAADATFLWAAIAFGVLTLALVVIAVRIHLRAASGPRPQGQ